MTSIRSGTDEGRQSRVAVAVDGDVSPAEQIRVFEALQELWRESDHGVVCARCRIDTRMKTDSLAIVDGIVVLDDGRVLFACSIDRTLDGAVRDVKRRLLIRMEEAGRRLRLDRTA